MMERPSEHAICRLCGRDCSDQSHIRDLTGQTFCRECFERAVVSHLASPVTPRVITPPGAEEDSTRDVPRPTSTGSPAPRPDRTQWPTIIGTLSIIVALFMIGGALITLPDEVSIDEARALGSFLASVIITGFHVWLLAAAIGLLYRNRIGVIFLQIWAILYAFVMITLIGIFIVLVPPYLVRELLWSVLISVLVYLGWPVFLIVWFSRGSIRDDVRQWRKQPPTIP